MLDHHRETLDRAIEEFKARPEVLAILLAGSVAKCIERPDSDVDLMVVLEPSAFEDRDARNVLNEVRLDLSTYERGYVDAKFIDEAFLEDAAQKGSEPTRNAFAMARIVYSKLDGLEEKIARIVKYPEWERSAKLLSFYGQLRLQSFFIQEAAKRNDPFLAHYSAAEAVLFAGRLILAYDRVIFPSQKRLMETVLARPELPPDYEGLCYRALQDPKPETVEPLIQAVVGFRDWEIDPDQSLTQFTKDAELAWRHGTAAVCDR